MGGALHRGRSDKKSRGFAVYLLGNQENRMITAARFLATN
jgi:hypothetical protein